MSVRIDIALLRGCIDFAADDASIAGCAVPYLAIYINQLAVLLFKIGRVVRGPSHSWASTLGNPVLVAPGFEPDLTQQFNIMRSF
jgi:hypothetical protein